MFFSLYGQHSLTVSFWAPKSGTGWGCALSCFSQTLPHPQEDPAVGLKDAEDGLWGQTRTPASRCLDDVLRQRALTVHHLPQSHPRILLLQKLPPAVDAEITGESLPHVLTARTSTHDPSRSVRKSGDLWGKWFCLLF